MMVDFKNTVVSTEKSGLFCFIMKNKEGATHQDGSFYFVKLYTVSNSGVSTMDLVKSFCGHNMAASIYFGKSKSMEFVYGFIEVILLGLFGGNN